MRFFASGFFVPFSRLACRFPGPGFFTPKFLAAGCVAAFAFGLLTTWQLDAAKGAAERFDFALVVVLLMFGQFDQFEDFFHLLQRLFEGFHDVADFVGGFADGGQILFGLRPLGRAMNGIAFSGPFYGWLLRGGRFGKVFLWRGCGWFVGDGCGRRSRSGWLATAASTTAAASTASAVRTFPRLRLT